MSGSVQRHVDVMLLTPAGQVFQAALRVNGADRSQAFVSIGGLTSDVLVKVMVLLAVQGMHSGSRSWRTGHVAAL